MTEFKRERLIAVLGPTASGKTALSVALAKRLGTEIISGDSMLVYRGFDIGSIGFWIFCRLMQSSM